jgi:hypothetical protein
MTKRSIVAALAVLGVLLAAAPAQAVVDARGELRRVTTTSYELLVHNTGDESFNAMQFVRFGDFSLINPRSGAANCVTVGTSSIAFDCDGFTLVPGATRTFRFDTDRPYPTGNGGQLTVQVNPGGRFDGSLVTGPPAGTTGEPALGRSQFVEPLRGVVLVRRRGSRRFVRLRRGQLLPDRSEIDTRRGTARIKVASDQPGGLSTATVSEGRGIIDQNRARRPTTTLELSEPLACPRRATAAATARARKQRQIFVKTNGGRFKTRGNHAAGTATGTAWRTTDTCSTTTIKVAEGTVRVRDLRRRRTLNLTAPGSYTARRN